MADSQHLEWLKEGVEAWNERRRGRLFKPDFSSADLLNANLLNANLRRANLQDANLRGVDLQDADLWAADLQRANLRTADLRRADLWGAKLQGADLRDAKLQGADLRGVNLRLAKNLTQRQLNSAVGNASTVIPDDLERPAHWHQADTAQSDRPAPRDTPPPAEQTVRDHLETSTQSGPGDLNERVIFLLQRERAAGTSLTAGAVAFHIETMVQFHRQKTNTLGPEIALLDEMVLTLRAIADKTAVETPNENDLLQEIEKLKQQVADLTQQLEHATKTPSEFAKAFQKSAGKALGTAAVAGPIGLICGGLGYLLGPAVSHETLAGLAAGVAGGIGALNK